MASGNTVDKLTNAEVKLLAIHLLSEHGNVYRVTESMFNKKVEEEVFDQLRAEAEIFKCELCDRWLNLHDRCTFTEADMCEDCVTFEEDRSDDSERW